MSFHNVGCGSGMLGLQPSPQYLYWPLPPPPPIWLPIPNMFNPFATQSQAAASMQPGRLPEAGIAHRQKPLEKRLASLTTPSSHSEALATSSYFQSNRNTSGVELLAQTSMKRPNHGSSDQLAGVAAKRAHVSDTAPVAALETARPQPAHPITSMSLGSMGRGAPERPVTRPPYYCGTCRLHVGSPSVDTFALADPQRPSSNQQVSVVLPLLLFQP